MFYEDNAVATRIFMRAKHFEYIREPLYYYYQHNASTVHTVTEERCRYRMEAMRMMLEAAKEDGSLTKYFEEVEYRFVNLFYENTLFSYVANVRRGQQEKGVRLGFLRELAKGVKKEFPDFEKNRYYQQRTDAEARKLIHIQLRSSFLFLLYYKLIWWVRGMRKG